jgi:hypothetical protein
MPAYFGCRDPAGNLNSVSYQRNVDYRLLSMIAERYVSPQLSLDHHLPLVRWTTPL